MIANIKAFLFENRDSRQTFTKNVFWLASSQVGSRLVRAAIIVYAARVLGAAEYGVFSYVVGFATFFIPFVDLGINAILTKEVANQPEENIRYFRTALWLKLVLLGFSTLPVIFLAPYLTNIAAAAALVPWVAFLVIFDGIRDFQVAYLRGKERMEKEALAVISMNVLITAFGFAALSLSPTSKAFLFSYIAGVAVSAIIPVPMLQVSLRSVFHFEMRLAWEMLRSGWPIALSTVLGLFMLNTDIVMLGWWRSAEEIGHYAASQRVIQILYALPGLAAVAAFPALSRLTRENDAAKRRLLNERILTALLTIAIPLTLGGTLFASPVIHFLFGAPYAPAVPMFQILSLTFLLIFPGIFISYAVIAYNKQRQTVGFTAAGALGNILLNAILIPRYGPVGAAAATVVAQVLSYGGMWFYLKRVDTITVLPYLKKILVAALLMGGVSVSLNAIGAHILLTITLSAILYFTVLYLLGEETLKEGLRLIQGKDT